MATHTQHLAYVLKPGEVDAPQGLKAGLKAANRLQDLTMQFATVGRTGNQALRDARMQAVMEGLVRSRKTPRSCPTDPGAGRSSGRTTSA